MWAHVPISVCLCAAHYQQPQYALDLTVLAENLTRLAPECLTLSSWRLACYVQIFNFFLFFFFLALGWLGPLQLHSFTIK